MTTETSLSPVSDREKRLATAIAELDDRERQAYRYFVRTNQVELAESTADEMFQLYTQGSTCEDIRRARPGFSLGQVVACKVIYEWNARRAEYRARLKKDVPDRAAQVAFEQVDFMADLLTASSMVNREAIRQYMATGNPEFLKGVPIPVNTKQYLDLMAGFMTATGQDKKRVEVSGSVTVDSKTGIATTVTPEEAASIMNKLLGDDIQDAEFVEVKPAVKASLSDPVELPPGVTAPKTAEQMIEFLVGTGVPQEKARSIVDSMNNDIKRYADLVVTLLKKDTPVN